MGASSQDKKLDESARSVLAFAEVEAKRLKHNYIGTEHLLLGLLWVEDGLAASALDTLGIDLDKVRKAVEFIIGRGERQVAGDIGLTPRAKKVMQLAREEAGRLGAEMVSTEHILLGLIREGEGIAAGVLESLGVSLERVRTTVIELVGKQAAGGPPAEEGAPSPGSESWEYLTIPTVIRDGVAYPRTALGDTEGLAGLSETPIAQVLETLSENRWLPGGIDISPQGGAGVGPLYVLKRRKGA